MSCWCFSKTRRMRASLAAPPVFSSGIAALALLQDGQCSQGKSCFANYTTCPVLPAPRHLIRTSLKTDGLSVAKLRLADLEKNERESAETRESASKERMTGLAWWKKRWWPGQKHNRNSGCRPASGKIAARKKTF